jgi:integrase
MDIVPVSGDSEALVSSVELLKTSGAVANELADKTAHRRYQNRRSYNTRRRQHADIHLFALYLALAHYEHTFQPFLDALKADHSLQEHWAVWEDVTYGLVEGFVEWQQLEGYAIGSIAVRLSTVKVYCELASRAGAIETEAYERIRRVRGIRHREGINIDKGREKKRRGKKKAEPTIISHAHAELLKRQKRAKDAAIMCLLLDLGLRVGELVHLTVSSLQMNRGTITFYREKVDKIQTHQLTGDCLAALQRYLPEVDGEYLFPGYRNSATGEKGPMRTSAVNKQVGILGKRIGIEQLSPHDCRHYRFTEEIEQGTDIKTLQEMGGWASPVMPLRYATSGEIVNSGASFFRQATK